MTRRLGYIMISRVGRATSSRFLSLLPLDASVHQMPFYLKMYLNLLVKDVRVYDFCTRRWSVCAKGYIKCIMM